MGMMLMGMGMSLQMEISTIEIADLHLYINLQTNDLIEIINDII